LPSASTPDVPFCAAPGMTTAVVLARYSVSEPVRPTSLRHRLPRALLYALQSAGRPTCLLLLRRPERHFCHDRQAGRWVQEWHNGWHGSYEVVVPAAMAVGAEPAAVAGCRWILRGEHSRHGCLRGHGPRNSLSLRRPPWWSYLPFAIISAAGVVLNIHRALRDRRRLTTQK
jgi:hypothetical protein